MTFPTAARPPAGPARRPPGEDRRRIRELVARYTVLLDTHDANGFDAEWPRTVFTRDARLRFPIGEVDGLDGVAAFHHEAKAKFESTRHRSFRVRTALRGDLADVRFRMRATHVHPERHGRPGPLFEIGGHYTCEAARTEQGWRFRALTFHLSWQRGPGPA
ncbi:nuclear transport factor 2 family protein [Streptomyces sp. HNM0574]|uniref:nuclear transport factor 2 family protein n=1 Tax=Streptomyces sp. HNM0574 TaxID=2714954 RepID=UPI00146AE994|nr:nuclear transport factor 2 family protein [Streptomyces sp. HNM0574]